MGMLSPRHYLCIHSVLLNPLESIARPPLLHPSSSASNKPMSPIAIDPGSFVQLHGLKSASHLNGSTALVLRFDPTSSRHAIQLRPNPTAHAAPLHAPSRIIAARPANLRLIVTDHLVESRDQPSFPPWNPVQLQFNRETLFKSSSILNFYYAYSNTSPTYLFVGVPSTQHIVRVLTLGTGDICSHLYSLARDSVDRCYPTKRQLHFVVNDAEPSIIARNLIFIWLIMRRSLSPSHLFSIWFSLRISDTAYAALCDAVIALTGPHAKQELDAINVGFHNQLDWHRVRHVLRNWILWQDQLEWSKVVRMRQQCLFDKLGNDFCATLVSSGGLSTHHKMSGDVNFPHREATAEYMAFAKSGVILFKDQLEPSFTNPTMFLTPDKYELHYGSVPYKAFATFASTYDEETPLLTFCLQQMDQWIKALLAHEKRVHWVFNTASCTHLATDLATEFHVVATTNVADHVGLLPLLQALRGTVAPNGYLLTQTLRWTSYSDTPEDYLRKNLLTDPEYWSGVHGWRCIGYEGALVTEETSFDCMIPINALLPTSRESCKEFNFLWTPSFECNIPLQILHAGLETVMDTMKSELVSLCSLRGLRQTAAMSFGRTQMMSLLPILCAITPSDLHKSIALREDFGTDVFDLARCLRDPKSSRIELASTDMSEDTVKEFLAMLLALNRGFEIINVSVETKGGNVFTYTGLTLWFDEEKRMWTICWLLDASRLDGCDGNAEIRLNFGPPMLLPPKILFLRNIRFTAVTNDTLEKWRNRFMVHGSAMNEFLIDREEDKETYMFSCRIPESWMDAVSADVNKLYAKVVQDDTRQAHKVEIRVKQKGGDCVVAALPGPILSKGIKISVSKKKGVLQCIVQKARFDLASMMAKDYWLGDEDAWVVNDVAEQHLQSMSGLQLDMEERRISDGKARGLVPRFISMKTNMAHLFQCHDEKVMVFGTERRTGCSFDCLILHDGLRREHRHGTIIADVSVLFLNGGADDRKVRDQIRRSKVRFVPCEVGEVNLLKEIINAFSARSKNADSQKALAKVGSINIPKRLRKRFIRAFLPPLLSRNNVRNMASGGKDHPLLKRIEKMKMKARGAE